MIYTMQQYNQALIDVRVGLSGDFKRELARHSAPRCKAFMLRYCQLGGQLALLFAEWTTKMAEVAQAQSDTVLADFLKTQVTVMQQRHQLLHADAALLAESLGEALSDPILTPGGKQLRALFRDCLRHRQPAVWLAILFELCRIRLVHGSVLVQLCRGYFHGHLLRRLRHVRFEHRQNATQLTAMDALLHRLLQQGAFSDMRTMIVPVKAAISAYGTFIHDCCEMVMA